MRGMACVELSHSLNEERQSDLHRLHRPVFPTLGARHSGMCVCLISLVIKGACTWPTLCPHSSQQLPSEVSAAVRHAFKIKTGPGVALITCNPAFGSVRQENREDKVIFCCIDSKASLVCSRPYLQNQKHTRRHQMNIACVDLLRLYS